MAAAPPANAPAKVRLGDLLIRDGLLRPDQLQRGLEEQQAFGGRLGRHLVDLGFVTEATLLDALSRQLRIPRIDLDAPGAVANDIARYCRADIAERMGFCPVAVDPKGKILTIAVADPEPQTLLDIESLTGMRIEPRLALLDAIDRVNRRLYDGSQLQVQQMRGLQPSRQAEKAGPGPAPTTMDEALGPPPPRPSAPPPPAPPQPFDTQLQHHLQQQQLQQQQLQAQQQQLHARLQQQQLIQQMQMQGGGYAGQPTMGFPQGYPAQPPYPGYPGPPPPARPAAPTQASTPAPPRPPPTPEAPVSRVAPLLPTPGPVSLDDLSEQVKHLEKTLAAQARALRSFVEVLVDKGVITKAEMARKQQK